MKIKKILLREIIDFLGVKLMIIKGDIQNDDYIDNIVDVDRVNEKSLDWINPSKVNKQEIAEISKAHVLLVDEMVEYNDVIKSQNKILLVVQNPKLCLAEIGNHFFVDNLLSNIHPTVIIDKKAQIGRNVCIGPYCVIDKAIIGDNCIIDSNVHIYDSVTIGHDCVVKSGAVLGGAGFGYERDADGNLFRFPQIGQLLIGNYVEVGANTCIDKGALSDTEIGDYTKINNLCHIAHNNKIGKNVIITGCVNISGSNIIKDNVWIAPNSSVKGWVTIGENTTIGMGAVVVNNIPSGETWVGCPAKKLR